MTGVRGCNRHKCFLTSGLQPSTPDTKPYINLGPYPLPAAPLANLTDPSQRTLIHTPHMPMSMPSPPGDRNAAAAEVAAVDVASGMSPGKAEARVVRVAVCARLCEVASKVEGECAVCKGRVSKCESVDADAGKVSMLMLRGAWCNVCTGWKPLCFFPD